jgi:hypothetical protein
LPNQNGCVYGLTFLAPIRDEKDALPSHDLQLRNYLAKLPTDERSPLAIAPGTHLARLVVMDDVIYVGSPAREEHLKSKYLVFETNCDCDTADYLTGLAKTIPTYLDNIWGHCVGYPGSSDPVAFVHYMKSCQIETTFFFPAVNDKSVSQTLAALQTQRAVADFITRHQGVKPEQTQRDFLAFLATLDATPVPPAGSMAPPRDIKTGGRNE